MKKGNFIKQNRNYLKENYILKVYDKNNKFLYNFVGNVKEISKFLLKNENLLISKNVLLSEIFLTDLIKIKISKKEFLFI